MKKNMLFAALAAFGALFLSSCQEEMNPVDSVTDTDGLMTITAAFPETVESKVDFTQQADGTGLDLTWNEDDYLIVTSGANSQKFEISSIDGKKATFKGVPVEGTTFDIVLSRSDDYAARSYEGQTQTAIASTDHLLYDAVLKGVDSYSDLSFTSEWAVSHGGTLSQNGCLLVDFKMPDDAGYLKTVTLSAPETVFYTTNSADGAKTAALTLALDNVDMSADNVVKAYIMTSMQEASVSAGTELTLTVASNLGTWSKKFTPGAFTLKAGKRNVITLNDKNWTVPTGDGSEANPYILRTADDLTGMAYNLATEKKYFAMVNDIDMSSVTEWIKIENPIDFNGNNRTISTFKPTQYLSNFPGFIGVLNGKVANLSIIDAAIENTGKEAVGILCGYCGNQEATVSGEIINVHVKGTISETATGESGRGGLVGLLGSGRISRSSADVNIQCSNKTHSKCRVGGLVGGSWNSDVARVCEISDCWTAGTVSGSTQKTGGIIGELCMQGTKAMSYAVVRNCYSSAIVQGVRAIGGIVGNMSTSAPSSVECCIAWNSELKTTGAQSGNYSSGAVIGHTKNFHTMKDCYRNPGMTYNVSFTDKPEIKISPCDQPNADTDNKYTVGTYQDNALEFTEFTNYFPYHGKAASAGETVSDVAKLLGWDEKIWDLSGDYPQLIK